MVAPWPSGPGSENVPSLVSVKPVSASSLVALPTRRRMLPRAVRRVRTRSEGGAASSERPSGSRASLPWPPAARSEPAVTECPGAGAACGGPTVGPKSVSEPRRSSIPRRIHASSLGSCSGRTIPRVWYTCGIAASGMPARSAPGPQSSGACATRLDGLHGGRAAWPPLLPSPSPAPYLRLARTRAVPTPRFATSPPRERPGQRAMRSVDPPSPSRPSG